MLTLAMVALPSISAATFFSRMGATMRQGPHQGPEIHQHLAQRSQLRLGQVGALEVQDLFRHSLFLLFIAGPHIRAQPAQARLQYLDDGEAQAQPGQRAERLTGKR